MTTDLELHGSVSIFEPLHLGTNGTVAFYDFESNMLIGFRLTDTDTAIDSSVVDKATKDKKSEDDDDTKGWDKSVKINPKGSKKKRRKTKSNNAKPNDSANQGQNIVEDSYSPESIKSKKSA